MFLSCFRTAGFVHQLCDASNELDVGKSGIVFAYGGWRVFAVETFGLDQTRTIPWPFGQIPVEGHRQLFHVLVYHAGKRNFWLDIRFSSGIVTD